MTEQDVKTWAQRTRVMLATVAHLREQERGEDAMCSVLDSYGLAELRAYMDTFEGSPRELEEWAHVRLLGVYCWAAFLNLLRRVEELGAAVGADLSQTLADLRSFDGERAERAFDEEAPLIQAIQKAKHIRGGGSVIGSSHAVLSFLPEQWHCLAKDFAHAMDSVSREGGWEGFFWTLRAR